MKKVILTALFVPVMALAQSYPSPTFSTLTLQTPLAAANGGTGTTTSTGSGSLVLSTSPTLTGPTLSNATATGAFGAAALSATGTVSGAGFTNYFASPPALGGTTPNTVNATAYSGSITPSATSLTTNCPNITGGSGGYCVNQINIGPSSPYDTATLANSANFVNGFTILHNYGAGFTGGRQTFVVQGQVVGASGASNTNHNYVAGVFQEGAQANDGGTGTTSGTAKGAVFAMNPIAVLYNGATNYLELSGAEVNIAAQTGSSVYYKSGWSIIESATDAVQGSVYDAALSVSSMTGAVGWQNGILFGPANGQFPISSTGCLICSSGSGTAGTGIDFSSLTLTNFLKGPSGFVVSGAGALAAASISTTGPIGVRYSQPNIAVGDTGSSSSSFLLQDNTTNVWSLSNNTATNQFFIGRYVGGAYQDNPIAIANATGVVTLTDGLAGVTNGGAATTGNVGEVQSANTNSTSLTTGTAANATSKLLPAGDWDVTCTAQFVPAGSTIPTAVTVGVNTTSATLPGANQITQIAATMGTGSAQMISTPPVQINIAASTTVYCPVSSNFTASTMTVNGWLRARRLH